MFRLQKKNVLGNMTIKTSFDSNDEEFIFKCQSVFCGIKQNASLVVQQSDFVQESGNKQAMSDIWNIKS